MADTHVLPARTDGINWQAHAHVDRFSADQSAFAEARIDPSLVPNSREWNAALAALLRSTGAPEDGTYDEPGNLLVTEGLNQLTQLIIGSGGVSFNGTHGLIAVGDSSTGAAVGDTYVTATFTSGSNCYQNPNDNTFPTQSNGLMTSQSTFGSSVANFAWNTWGWAVYNGTAAANATLSAHGTGSNQAVLVNHKVPSSSIGTKGSGSSWIFTTTVTLS